MAATVVKKKPKVWNKHNTYPVDAVYIGRPSKWGNPFKIGQHGTREEVICQYEEWIRKRPNLMRQVKSELVGKDLVCFCSPQACHGDVLLRIANEEN